MKTLRIKTNLVFGIIAVCTAVALWLIIPWQVPASLITNEKIDGRFMPRLLAVLMAICGISCIIKSLVFKNEDVKTIACPIEMKNIIYLGMVIVYGILAIYVSFILSSIVFGCCLLLYMKTKDFRKYLVVTVVIIAVSIAFKYGLRVRFGGIWGI